MIEKHPNPQFARENFLLLDGEWEFEIDNVPTVFYWQPEIWKKESLPGRIRVPYPVESSLSGVNDKEFNLRLWYRKTFFLSKKFERVLLKFGAVDYEAEVWVNKRKAFSHRGGYVPFGADITSFVREGENEVFVCVRDDCTDPRVPSGKQSPLYNSFSAYYTRCSGIWQPVWLEFCGDAYIESVRCDARLDGAVAFGIQFGASAEGYDVCAEVFFEEKKVAQASARVGAHDCRLYVAIPDPVQWSCGCGNLYEYRLTLTKDGAVSDRVCGYFAFREVGFADNVFTLNGKPLFLRLVLDQGYYKEGVYAPADAREFARDIRLAMSMGFNGARLHEKVFDPRYLYFADKMGFLVWGEYPNFGLSIDKIEALAYILPEWLSVLKRDVNHPCIVAWCPFNETETNDFCSGALQDARVISAVYEATRMYDPSRPVVDVSGSMHTGVTDIYDVHDYTQDEKTFVAHYKKGYFELYPDKQSRKGEPYMVTEFGGILWDKEGTSSWGYGEAPESEGEFLTRFSMMVETLLNNPDCTGFCYTQLYDVEQEKNGLYTFDREAKFDPALIGVIVGKRAAVEKQKEDKENG